MTDEEYKVFKTKAAAKRDGRIRHGTNDRILGKD